MNELTKTHTPTPLYAVASGKGGVGKTSLTLNMATLLARQGKKVLVFDGDTGLANLDVQLNIKPQYDLLDVFTGRKTLAETIVKTPQGMSFIPGRSGHGGLANLPLAAINKLMAELRAIAGEYTHAFIDVAAGVHQQALALCAAADYTLLVTTPDPSAFTDAYALLKLLWKDHGLANCRLIINQASAREAEQIHKKLEQAAEHFLGLPEVPLLGHVPPCRQYASAVKMHQLAAVAFPTSSAVAALEVIVPKLPR
jgi:flagellar biosynthesis protein FlhG